MPSKWRIVDRILSDHLDRVAFVAWDVYMGRLCEWIGYRRYGCSVGCPRVIANDEIVGSGEMS